MKIKLFEKFNINDLINNIKDSFSDLIDDEIVSIDTGEEMVVPEGVVAVMVDFERYTGSSSLDSFDVLYSNRKKEQEVLEKIQNSLKFLTDNHNTNLDIDSQVEYDSDYINITFYIKEGDSLIGDFWKKSPTGEIRLDYKKIIKLVGFPRNDKNISMSSTGSYKMITFYFSSKEELNNNKDELMKKFMSLRVMDKPITMAVDWIYPSKGKENFQIGERRKNRHDRSREMEYYISFALNDEIDWHW
jgi:hypothetical protein